jgi:L-cysteine S-thiosulfotransferase
MRRAMGGALLGLAALVSTPGAAGDGEQSPEIARFTVVGAAIPEPLSGKPGDPARGRRIVLDRELGNCLICHQVPEAGEPFQGDLGPNLAGVGRRLSPGQIRLRLVDQSRLNPATVMPPYHRVDGLNRVAAQYRGRPVLSAEEIEDVVAYLAALTE